MKVKEKSVILSEDIGYDIKHKLNTVLKLIPKDILDTISEGVTLELLDDIQERGFNVFKYKTQITVHGVSIVDNFDRINRYKNLIVNKNRSIGIKYSAVCCKQRSKLYAKLFRHIDFSYHWNSISNYFSKLIFIDIDKYKSNNKEIKELGLRIKDILMTKEIYGTFNIFVGNIYWSPVIDISLTINGIYDKDIDVYTNNAFKNNIKGLLEKFELLVSKSVR